jgi:hypothetical protein
LRLLPSLSAICQPGGKRFNLFMPLKSEARESNLPQRPRASDFIKPFKDSPFMHRFKIHPLSSFTALFISALLLVCATSSQLTVASAQTAARTPAETVREFYKAMRERRFREAFAMSIYKPAIEGLSQEEFEDLRPDFEKMAAAIPEKININGEQTSGDLATVFVKVASGDDAAEAEPVALMRSGNDWIIGDKDNQSLVRASGKEFFFKARIDTHHNEVQAMLQRILIAELAYGQQHNGQLGDLAALINAGLVPKDLEGTDSTGYRFHLALATDAKSYTAGAEPARYGRTGRLSFFLDQTGIRSGDVGGKPLTPQPGPK